MPIHNYCKNQSKRIVSAGKNNSDIQIGQGSTPVMAGYIHMHECILKCNLNLLYHQSRISLDHHPVKKIKINKVGINFIRITLEGGI